MSLYFLFLENNNLVISKVFPSLVPHRNRGYTFIYVCALHPSPQYCSETTGLSNQVKTTLRNTKLLQAIWKQVAGTRTILLASPQRGRLQDNFTFYSPLEFSKAETFDWKMSPSTEETSSSGTQALLDAAESDHEIWHHGKEGSTLFNEFLIKGCISPLGLLFV